LFYEFSLERYIPADHLLRPIDNLSTSNRSGRTWRLSIAASAGLRSIPSSEAISETEELIAAMDEYLDYMSSMKNDGCYGENVGAQSAVIVMFKAQRDELVWTKSVSPNFLRRG
jgi:GH18 family chitinase